LQAPHASGGPECLQLSRLPQASSLPASCRWRSERLPPPPRGPPARLQEYVERPADGRQHGGLFDPVYDIVTREEHSALAAQLERQLGEAFAAAERFAATFQPFRSVRAGAEEARWAPALARPPQRGSSGSQRGDAAGWRSASPSTLPAGCDARPRLPARPPQGRVCGRQPGQPRQHGCRGGGRDARPGGLQV
jgi:hypothetical protein